MPLAAHAATRPTVLADPTASPTPPEPSAPRGHGPCVTHPHAGRASRTPLDFHALPLKRFEFDKQQSPGLRWTDNESSRACAVVGPHSANKSDRGIRLPSASNQHRSPSGRPHSRCVTSGQRRFWFLDQLERHNPFHNQLVSLELHGVVEPSELMRRLAALTLRHDILRARFTAHEGQPLQQIQLEQPPAFRQVDLQGLPPAEREAREAALASEEALHPFDLETGPLLRATLVKRDAAAHLLLLSFHQMVCDAGSVPVLVESLAAVLSGRDDVAGPYVEVAERQQQWLRSAEAKQQVEAWRVALDGAPQVLALPTDQARPTVQTYNSATGRQGVPLELTRRLEALARAEGADLFDVLLAALQAVLYRYTGQEDLCIGTPSSLREPSARGVLGWFGNMLVLRGHPRAATSFREQVSQARRTHQWALAHAAVPFEHLVETLQVERSLVYTPYFQVTLELESAPPLSFETPGVSVRQLPLERRFARYDLSLTVTPGPAGLELAFTYNADLFHADTVRGLQGHLLNVLRHAVQAPETRLGELSLLSAEELERTLRTWNETTAAYPRERLIHELIAEQARLRPDAVAVTHGEGRLTYGELERSSNQMAHALRARGLGPGRLAGICVERSLEMLVGLLGILKAGGAYLPLDPTYPRERLRYMLRDSGAALLVTQERLVERLPSQDVPVLVLEQQALDALSAEPPLVRMTSEQPAYVIYTSGSTGKPKGVLLSHRGLVNHVTSLQGTYQLTTEDRILQCTSISFDISLEEIFPTLATGATLVLLPFERLPSVAEFLRMVEHERLTVLNVPTAYWHEWVTDATLRQAQPPPDVRLVIVGGERAAPEQLAAWRALTGERLGWFNAYGPTEATITSTLFALPPGAPTPGAHLGIPIGRPIANTRVCLLDANGRPVPVGVPGELYIGGDGLAHGYLGRPELTAERFVPDAFSGEPGARLYRTGDLASQSPDGQLRFLGRVDHQVKVRGFRIELGELEAHLMEHPAVRDAVAVAREDSPGQPRLVAYVVPSPPGEAWGDAIDEQELNDEQISQWQTLYDDAYHRAADEEDGEFNTASWNSSYTGQPITAEEMREFVDHSVQRILDLKPRRVLEIGCGTGLLLVRIAPHCEHFTGADFAQGALKGLQRFVDKMSPKLGSVALLHRGAEDFTGIEPGSHDTVVINSVLQHFPTVDYLVKVLEGAVATVGERGRVFVGDVRSLSLLESFALSVELFRARDTLPLEQLSQAVRRRVSLDNELVVDPAFFLALRAHLPRIQRVDLWPKRGQHHNELTCFRYDVVLHVGDAAEAVDPYAGTVLDWKRDGLSMAKLRRRLETERPEQLAVTRIPNARLTEVRRAREILERDERPSTVGELRAELRSQPEPDCVNPEELWALEAELPYAVSLHWSGGEEDGAFELRLLRRGAVAPPLTPSTERAFVAKPWRAYTNQPLQAALTRQLVPLLQEHLKQRVPEYMVPSAILSLDVLPRTPNGKVDRKALPAPSQATLARQVEAEAARTPVEELLAGIWAEVLGGNAFGLHDNFFEQGGHSLLATQVISRVGRAFGVELPLHALFETPTLRGLAEKVTQELRTRRGVSIPPVRAAARGDTVPASSAQARLWFTQRMDPTGVSYNTPFALELKGRLDVPALEKSLQALARRHEALRTTFREVDEALVQVIHAFEPRPLPVVDLGGLPESEQEQRRQETLDANIRTPFDLEHGPLLRQVLIRMGEEDHLLLLTLHHIVSDGWSMGVVVQELGRLYAAFRDGLESPLEELTLQYADYALWQRQWLQGETLERGLTYWKQQLGSSSGELVMPTDRPRASATHHRSAIQRARVSAALVSQLDALCRREGVTLFMTLLATWNILLRRYSGQVDINVGTPIANRHRAEIEGLVGFFVNSLVLRTDMSDAPSFRALMHRVRDAALEAYAHQDIPFERIVEAVSPERRLDQHPLFQVMFALHNAPLQPPTFDELSMSFEELGTGTAKFELILTTEQDGSELDLALEYDTDLYDAATIERMLGHYQALLASAVRAPDTSITTLPLLTDAERQQLLVDWNATSTDFPRHQSIHQLFSEQARATPEAIALHFGEEVLTYAQLEARANQLAWHLQSFGVRPDTLVGLYLERSPTLITAMLACLKAGSAYLPLDTSYPPERLAFMLQDARAPLLVTTEALSANLPVPSGVHVIELDSDERAISRQPTRAPATETAPSNLAYAIYTSGSTGQPKGIVVPHLGVVRLVRDSNFVQLSAADRIAQISNASFDAATFEIWGALLNGGALIGVPRDVSLSPSLFAEYLRRERISALFITSALFTQIVHQVPDAFATVSTVLFGGEIADTGAVRSALLGGPPQRLINAYGPTENTTFSTWHLISRAPPPGHAVPIGIPLSNSTVYVLDEALQPVPIGVPGELYLGGEGLARGYLHQPALTAERFVAHPFEPQARLYKSGDIVRWLPDGHLEFVGRRDHQVKIRGFRIELGEIEAALTRSPDIDECVVLAREDSPGDRRLVAYFTSSRAPAVPELRERLKGSLPEYMVPSAFVRLPSLPLTLNGKVDRKALPSPDGISAPTDSYVAPRTPIEELLANLWAHLLSVPRVGVEDNFFDLGGHSLLATQLLSRIRANFGKELPLRALFQNATVAGLAQLLSSPMEDTETGPLVPISRDQELEASFAQQRLWLVDQLEPGSSFYNVPMVLRVKGPLQPRVLEQGLDALVRRHEALRSTFEHRGGRLLVQVAEDAPGHTLPLVDLTHVPAEEREARARQLIETEGQRPFDLARGPLLRTLLVRLGETEHLLLLTVHHIISDGWSLTVLFQELGTCYEAFAAHETPNLPPLTIQYADFAHWQRKWLQGSVQQTQLDYWKKQLAGAPSLLELPTDRPRPATQRHRGATRWFNLEAPLVEALRKLSRQEGTTLFMTLLAAWQTLLSRYSGQVDISVGTPFASRNRAELEGLIGYCINSLVMRTDLSGAPSFKELLRRVREVALDAYAHPDVPFEQVVEALQPQRDPRYTPLFQVMFNLQSISTTPLSIRGCEVHPEEVQTGAAKFDMLMALEETSTGIVGEFEYDTDLFDATTIERMLGHFQTLLASAVQHPGVSITALPLLTDAERQQLLVDWNATSTDFPRHQSIHQLFSEQARATPEAIALHFGEEVLTYAQLEARANQLAWHLQSFGVRPDTLVGLYLERSPTLITAMLACLKAGSAYLPLDTSYPPERLAFMLQDARAPLLVTTEALSGKFPVPDGLHVIEFDSDERTISRQPTTAPTTNTAPSNLAYAIYTSGSTGQPKGIVVPHLGVVRLVRGSEYIQLSSQDRVAQVSNASFDAATFEIWGALLNGGALIGVPRDVSLSPSLFVEYLRNEKVSVLFITTALFNQLANQVPGAFSTLSTVLFGGENVDAGAVRSVLLGGPPSRLLHVYGPTENTTFSTWHLVPRAPLPVHSVPIGVPLSNSTAFVLDDALQPVPVGVPGELYLGGEGLARGYLRQPELTAQRFIPNPFATGGRLYRSGDIVRRLPDGHLEFVGRRDHQVKLRGFRIELGEIEAALLTQPSVDACVVIVREDVPGDRRLVAYFTSTQPPSSTDLRESLKRSLPEYMVPSAFVCLAALPLSPNGKVDKKALPSPDAEGSRTDDFVEPGSPVEKVVAELMAEILNVSRLGAHDDFFTLGGHSLLATRFISLVQEILQVTVPLRVLFGNPTVATFSEALLNPPADREELLRTAELVLSLSSQPDEAALD
ncbi:amino acid adenylation domain-containing protein [Myxococcus faecalis]|uniref:amino acid adenylation domain-containing protein n=1 Tax=Myxococcus faecalis TaxID=3115646 RepID=UPI0038CFFB05